MICYFIPKKFDVGECRSLHFDSKPGIAVINCFPYTHAWLYDMLIQLKGIFILNELLLEIILILGNLDMKYVILRLRWKEEILI